MLIAVNDLGPNRESPKRAFRCNSNFCYDKKCQSKWLLRQAQISLLSALAKGRSCCQSNFNEEEENARTNAQVKLALPHAGLGFV
jgi:hypothetical protein